MKLAVALQRISNEYKQGIHLESSIRNNEASRSEVQVYCSKSKSK